MRQNTANPSQICGIYLSSSSNNMINDNDASNTRSGYGIYLNLSSNYNMIIDNNVSNSFIGIVLAYSSNYNMIIDNDASVAYYGIYLSASSNNNLTGNTANSNTQGIYLSASSNNNLTGNTVNSNNNYGIWLDSSSNNKIYNNIFNNTNNFYFYGSNINIWNTTRQAGINIIGGPYIGGNFWANPSSTGFSQACADVNRDGICDSSYTLASGNVDYMSLTIPAGYSYISGKAMNNSIGIANAVVTTNTSNTTNTDASGMYSLLVPTGTYNLTATKEPQYYPNSSVKVTVVAGTTLMQNIDLLKKPTGNISGSVSAK